ncbi:MAG TPA: hypothetical protein VH478_12500 [Trebonia sp.]|jgi:hypothetical protein|nr:hypothetical protein [Trebonia sp.]
MNEQGQQILAMLADGKITPDEAARLIDALGRDEPPALGAAPLAPGPKPRPKYLRVSVLDTSAGEPSKINIRIPLQLLRAGVRLTTLLPPAVLERANRELAKAGVPIDLTEFKPAQLEELIEQLDEVSVDVEDPESKIHIFCE